MTIRSGESNQNYWIVANSSYKSHVLDNPENDLEDPEAFLEDPDPASGYYEIENTF